MKDIVQLGIYLSQQEKLDFEKFARLSSTSPSRLGREILQKWMDDKKIFLGEQGYNFTQLAKEMENVKAVIIKN